ncbi:MAG TPA: protein-glutamate O-methyltransferase [Blastocatellia bacterium]|jgi:chemotaxis protein methyltransferase CheR|nr:protein-glutamate O-methyltransferase [Blastocatellia bacterium]
MLQLGSELSQVDILSDSEFRLFKDLIYSECGVSIGIEKRTFLESRLRRRMDELGIRSGYEYYCLVKHSQGRSHELPSLLDTLMICETSFFRNQPQFDLLRQVVLPEIIEKKERAGTRLIRVWSAGCSTGQEPYSAVIAMLEALSDAESWTLRVFASDLSFTALERAQCGNYREDQLKGIEPAFVTRYFRQVNGHYVISDAVKRRVIFDYHNLKHDNGLRGLDMVFCRNVMIYFDADEQRRLVTRFGNCLVPGGYLFLGHAESLQGLSGRFSMVHRNKGIAYRLES